MDLLVAQSNCQQRTRMLGRLSGGALVTSNCLICRRRRHYVRVANLQLNCPLHSALQATAVPKATMRAHTVQDR